MNFERKDFSVRRPEEVMGSFDAQWTLYPRSDGKHFDNWGRLERKGWLLEREVGCHSNWRG